MNATNGCETSMPYGFQSGLKGPYIVAEILIALLAITGNLLVCLAVTHNRKLRSVTNYFLVSLAIADILVGLLAIPCAVLTDLGRPRHDLPLCLLLLSVLMMLTQSSILSLLAVAAERYVAILLPFQYQRIMSPRNARLALLFTWSLAVLSGSVPLMDWHRQPLDSEYCIFTCMVDMTYMVYFNFFCCLLVPTALMCIIYGHIFITVHRQLRRITAVRGGAATEARPEHGSAFGSNDTGTPMGTERTAIRTAPGVGSGLVSASSGGASSSAGSEDTSSGDPKPTLRTRQELRTATSLFLVLFLFIVCWMPIHCINCVLLLCPKCPVPAPLTLVAILLSHANSALNPLLYAYRMRSFRHTLRGMCSLSGQPKHQ
ncbi:adenosine receptor A2b-like [Lampris incognitus]|uniref:adenosine receptor A2b-like n=1 Tax=Lampris incognitus TaxID=2546036 RepID=UPI0024B4F0D0|nr:adenosine receptor A2b-like [Lampris incognitus]